MSKDKLFDYYISKNPALAKQLKSGKVTMSANGFRKFFSTTYDEAYKQGFNQEPDVEEEEYTEPSSSSDTLKDLMGIFGIR